MSLNWPLVWKLRKASRQQEGVKTWLFSKMEMKSVTESVWCGHLWQQGSGLSDPGRSASERPPRRGRI